MNLSRDWNRIIAGFLAVVMVFLSVKGGALTTFATEVQEDDTEEVNLAIENPLIKSHFFQKLTFTWEPLGEEVTGYMLQVYDGAVSSAIGEPIEINGGDVNFYQYDTSELQEGMSVYYEIYGYVVDENEDKIPVTETVSSGKCTVNHLSEPLDVDVKWHVATDGDSKYLVVNVKEQTQEKLALWYSVDKDAVELAKNFTLDMTDGVTEFKYSLNEHGVSFDENGYIFITDVSKGTAFQDNGFTVGGEYVEPSLEPIEDVILNAMDESIELEAIISEESKMENFNYKYQWYEADDATSEGEAIDGANASKYEVKIGSFDEKYYYCKVTAEYLTKYVYITSNGTKTEDGVDKHTRVEGALFNTEISYVPIENQTFTGTEIKPELEIKNALGETLECDVNYTLTYSNNINAGRAMITVHFIGEYEGEIEDAIVYFTIDPKTASKETLEFTDVVTEKDYIYSGEAYVPEMMVFDPDIESELTQKEDYTIAYSGNVDAGTATITIKFKGNYYGTVYINFEIKPKSSDKTELATIPEQVYTGVAIVPDLIIKDLDNGNPLVVEKDYKVSCVNNTHVGTADVTITFIGNYEGEKNTTFKITPRDASEVSITAIADQEYTGLEIQPLLDVVYRNGEYVTVLTKETDYTVEYSNNIEIGTAIVTLKFSGDFKGSQVAEFQIVARNAENLVYGEIEEFEYSGQAFEPELDIKNGDIPLLEGIDYDVTYADNVNASTTENMAKAIVVFKGKYTGTKELTFKINPRAATNCDVIVEEGEYIYSGVEIEPVVHVVDGEKELEKEIDFIIEYANNINAGEATATVMFIGNYTGTAAQTFQIQRKPITAEEIEVEAIADQFYNGKAIVPNVVVKEKGTENVLRPELDYTVEGFENIYAGTAVLLIDLSVMGNYEYIGEKLEVNFEILPRDASNVIVLPIPEQRYTGKPVTPTVELMDEDIILVEGQDYIVEYLNNTNEGVATVIISFIGNYAGDAQVITFTIIDPVPTSITSSIFHVNQSKGYISKITVGTTVHNLWSKLNEKEYVSIFGKDGKTISGDKILATGMTVGVMDAGKVLKRYTIIVTGDTNGDGKINITDMIAVKACTLKKSGLSGVYEKAGDVNGDGKINITDFIKVKATTLKKDTIKGVSVK